MITKQCKQCNKLIKYLCRADMERKSKTGYCRKCYLKNIPRGDKHPYWKGGKIQTDSGYYMIRATSHPNANAYGYVREHRLVMEQHLGRYLEPWEIVHHKNEIRTDNRIENLELKESNSQHISDHHGRKSLNVVCSICGEKSLARALCKKHYWTNFLKQHRQNSKSDSTS